MELLTITGKTNFDASKLTFEPYKADAGLQQYSIVPKLDGKQVHFMVDRFTLDGAIPKVDINKTTRNHSNKCLKLFVQLNSSVPEQRELLKNLKKINKYVYEGCTTKKTASGEAFLRKIKVGTGIVAHTGNIAYNGFVNLASTNSHDDDNTNLDPRNFDENAEGIYYIGLNLPTEYEKDAPADKEKELKIVVREFVNGDFEVRNVKRLDELREYLKPGTELTMLISLKKFWLAKDGKCSIMLELTHVDVFKRGLADSTKKAGTSALDSYHKDKMAEYRKEYKNDESEKQVKAVTKLVAKPVTKPASESDNPSEDDVEDDDAEDDDADYDAKELEEELEKKRQLEEQERLKEEQKKKTTGKSKAKK